MTVTIEMVQEAEAHVPSAFNGRERWEWLATYLNIAIVHPGQVCPCCGVTNLGEDCSELPWVKKMMAEYRKEDQS